MSSPHRLLPGLVSVTFRKLSPAEIVALAKRASLLGIEWGGDIHAPHGDLARAREVRALTLDAGLRVAAYGSYYRAGGVNPDNPDFSRVLESAVALGAPTIRVWPGGAGSAKLDAEGRKRVVDDLLRIAGLAAAAGLSISTEFHDGTLTDTNDSARRLLAEAPHQPPFSPPSGPTQWLFQGPPAQSKFLAASKKRRVILNGIERD